MSLESQILAQEYMIRRSLMLLLGMKTKETGKETAIAFLPEIRTERSLEYQGIAFAEILAAFNIWASAKWLVETILPWLEIPYDYRNILKYVLPDLNIQGHIDWNATLDARSDGKQGFMIRHKIKGESQPKSDYIAFVLLEIMSHWNVIKERLTTHHGNFVSTEQFKNLEADIQDYFIEIESFLSRKLPSAFTRVSDKVEVARCLYEKSIASYSRQFLLEYAACAPCELPPNAGVISEVLRALVDWRTEYLSGKIWLSDNFGFHYIQNGSLKTVYTMWCFAELSLALVRNKAAEHLEHNLIVRQDVKGSDSIPVQGSFVYFNPETRYFHSAPGNPRFRTGEQLLPSLFPEWLIRDPYKSSDSIVIGASYEKISAATMLELLGHSRNCGIRNTVAFSPAPSEFTAGSRDVDGIYSIGPNTSGESLYIVMLQPGHEVEEKNRKILDWLVHTLIKPAASVA